LILVNKSHFLVIKIGVHKHSNTKGPSVKINHPEQLKYCFQDDQPRACINQETPQSIKAVLTAHKKITKPLTLDYGQGFSFESSSYKL
jgi:hypothetical protein